MSAEAVLGQLSDSINKLETFAPRLTNAINDTTTRVNSLISSVPGPLRRIVDDIIDQAEELLKRIWELAKQLCDWVAENVWPVISGPKRLYDAGNAWTTTVFGKVTEVSGQLDLSKSGVDDYWTGPAATAYAQTIPVQKAAADKIADAISKTREALQSLAFTLGALYIALVAGLLAALIQVMGGSAAVASVVGIPPGLMAIVSGLLTGIGTVGTVYAAGKELVAGSGEKFATLLEIQNDRRAFGEGGRWPKATSDIGDGSPSKWSYKQ
jgi:hypothetical protein